MIRSVTYLFTAVLIFGPPLAAHAIIPLEQ
jgi:hypothetical protein